MAKFGTRNVLFGYFWSGIWNEYCRFWKQYPQIGLIGKFREIIKVPKFGNANA